MLLALAVLTCSMHSVVRPLFFFFGLPIASRVRCPLFFVANTCISVFEIHEDPVNDSTYSLQVFLIFNRTFRPPALRRPIGDRLPDGSAH